MKISVRFTAAVHTLLCIDYFSERQKVTSEFIAGSTGVNAVIIRKILLQLQKVGLVKTNAGSGGSHLERRTDEITLLDAYKAINADEYEREVFSFHPNPNEKCPVGGAIHAVLDLRLARAQSALEAELAQTTLADLVAELPHNRGA